MPTVDAAPESDAMEITVGGRKAWVFQRKTKGVRQGNFYVAGNVPGGGTFYRSTGFSAKGMALDAAKKLWKARLEGRLDVLEETKLNGRKLQATIGELVQAHALAQEHGRLHVKAEVAGKYRSSLRTLVAWAQGLHSKPEGKTREKIDAAAVDKLSAEILAGELVDEFGRRYVAAAGSDHLARDQRLRGAHSILRNARAMFEENAMKAYRGLNLPALQGFLETALKEAEPVVHRMLEDAAVEEMSCYARGLSIRGRFGAVDLRENDKALYLVHLLFRHFGLRNDEIENARVEWIEILPVQQIKTVFLPNGETRHIVAVVSVRRRSYWIPKASEGDVGISADVLAELWPYLQGKAPDAHLVPADTATERWELIYRRHSDLVRPWTGEHQKTSYELRRWGATVVARLHQSEEAADRFLRHARKSTAQKHYLTERPLPAPITLRDCGL